MPTRTAVAGPRRRASATARPLAAKLPTASGSSAIPVRNALYPMTFSSHNGSAKSSPNSPRLTAHARTLPSRNEPMRNSERSSNTARPAALRRSSTTVKAPRAAAPSANATRTGEIAQGQWTPARLVGPVLAYQ